jgi:hypothetical protein
MSPDRRGMWRNSCGSPRSTDVVAGGQHEFRANRRPTGENPDTQVIVGGNFRIARDSGRISSRAAPYRLLGLRFSIGIVQGESLPVFDFPR